MKEYPNREALRKAHDIYRDAMRPFIVRCLKRVRGERVEDLICNSLDGWEKEQFKQGLQRHESPEALIDIRDFPKIIRRCWSRDRAFKQEFDPNSKIQYKTGTIGEGRNLWAHPGLEDVDPEHTRADLTYVAEVLGEIKNQDAKQAVESIRDQLFSDKVEEHPLEAENTAYKEQIADMTKQLDAARAENAELEKQLKAKSNRLEEVEAEWLACDERLETVSTQLKITVGEKTVAEERLSDISNRFQAAEVEKTELEKRLKVVEAEKAELEKRFPEDKDDEPSSDERVGPPTGKEMEQPALRFLIDRKEHRRVEVIDWLTEHFSLTDDERHYLSRTGQAEKHLMNKGLIERVRTGYYRITSRGLEVLGKNSSLGRNKKTGRAREAPDRYTKRTRVKRTNLPTGKEMEQPALEFLSDGREYPRIEIIDVLTDHFSLTKDQREVLSRSGRVELYLRNNGLIERTRTGYYRITDLGLEVVGEEFT